MAHTVKTKPDKIFAKLNTYKGLVPSDPAHNFVLDLFRGFSAQIILDIWNEEKEDVNYYFPAFVEVRSGWGKTDKIDLGRALKMGLLEITDGDDRAVLVKPIDKELEMLCANLHEAVPTFLHLNPLKKINARLLSHLRRCLLPEKQYKLQFHSPRFTIWSKFCNNGSTDEVSLTPSKWPEDAKVQMICKPEPLPFTVKAGVRIPRFTISFSISSSTCYLDEPHKFLSP